MTNQELISTKAARFRDSLLESANKRSLIISDLNEGLSNFEANMKESNISEAEKMCELAAFKRSESDRLIRANQSTSFADFEPIKVLGVGAFGLVTLVRAADGSLQALKQLNKVEVRKSLAYDSIMREREILVKARECANIVTLHSSFQDAKFLFLAMEYLPGGDLMTHLIKRNTFTEHESRYIIAEVIEALDFLHSKLNYTHRDCKPDNVSEKIPRDFVNFRSRSLWMAM